MFTPAVLDHFRQPRNAGELPDATHTVEVSNPVCGDVLRLAVRMEAEHIAEARFLCRGCTTAIAAASYLAEQLQGRAPREMLAASRSAVRDHSRRVEKHASRNGYGLVRLTFRA